VLDYSTLEANTMLEKGGETEVGISWHYCDSQILSLGTQE